MIVRRQVGMTIEEIVIEDLDYIDDPDGDSTEEDTYEGVASE